LSHNGQQLLQQMSQEIRELDTMLQNTTCTVYCHLAVYDNSIGKH